jgi:hypothetical protein
LKKLLKKHHNKCKLEVDLEVDLVDLEVDLEDLEVDLEDLEDLEVEVVVKVIDQLEKDVNLLLKYGSLKHC